jgi:phosphoribosylformylglycinamidine cyclo-ligase
MGEQSKVYVKSGVDQPLEQSALKGLISTLYETFAFRQDVGKPLTSFGHYAGIIRINDDLAIALKTDGVGSKVFVSQLVDKYDTIGIDCIAMVVNDIICTGAEPLSVIDYIAVQKPNPHLLQQIGVGLTTGAKLANVNVVGGEIAQLPEMINAARPGKGYDLVGMCAGLIDPKKIIDGKDIAEGDIVIGLGSSGIHSNGLSLARKIFFDYMKYDVNRYVDEFGRTLGEELLEPTTIYVPEIMEMIQSGLHLKNLAHITSEGLLNLSRVGEKFGYVIEYLPEPQPVFKLMQRFGKVSNLEMYKVCNMGIGMCIVLPKNEVENAMQIAEKHGRNCFVLGYAKRDPDKRIDFKTLKIMASTSKGMYVQ